jgi:hypothetical protein
VRRGEWSRGERGRGSLKAPVWQVDGGDCAALVQVTCCPHLALTRASSPMAVNGEVECLPWPLYELMIWICMQNFRLTASIDICKQLI